MFSGPKSIIRRFLACTNTALRSDPDPRLELLKRLPKSSIGAEVGVWRGKFSRKILDVNKPRELHLIDPWEFQGDFPDRMYGGKVAKSQDDMDKMYDHVRDQFRHNDNVTIHREFSHTALEGFRDDYLDWIYIDGNHYYDYVLRDLELSFRKVGSAGMITGDDYTWGQKDGFPVAAAVQHFVKTHGLGDNLEILDTQFIITL